MAEEENSRRKSIEFILSGRNSISNWSNYGNNEATIEYLVF
jgi:hypothetical protein